MTIRKLIELIDFIKSSIGMDGFSGLLQDYIITIQNNPNNLVLLKEITEKVIEAYEILQEKGIPDLLTKVLINKSTPFTEQNFHQRLIDLKVSNPPDPSTHYTTLNTILTQLQAKINENIVELDLTKGTVQPFLTKDYAEMQKDNNTIFAIVFNNENSYNNLKAFTFELKNWDRGLFIYQQIISTETPKPFEIIEIDQGSIEVVLNLLLDVGKNLLDLFKTGLEVYAAYLAYKTVVHDTLIKSYKGNKKLIQSEEDREKLLLENVKIAVREEIKKQSKKVKKHEALDKKIEEVTKLVTEHIIKGNNVKLLSAPAEEEAILENEKEKETFYMQSRTDYKKLDEKTKLLLLEEFTTPPPIDNYDNE